MLFRSSGDPSTQNVSREMKSLRDCISGIWDDYKWKASATNGCNRALGGRNSLAVRNDPSEDPKKLWCNASSSDFLKLPHIQTVLSSLPQADQDEAKRRVEKAEKTIDAIHGNASLEIKKQKKKVKNLEKKEADALKKGEEESDDLKEARKILRNLEQLHLATGKKDSNGDGIDRFAIYAALVAPLSCAQTATPRDVTDQITDTVSATLFSKYNPMKNDEQDDRWLLRKAAGRVMLQNPMQRLKESEVRSYAEEVGDLILRNRMDYIHRIEDSNADPKRPSRNAQGVCMEQWIVQHVLDPAKPLQEDQALFEELFSIPFNTTSPIQQVVDQAITDAQLPKLPSYSGLVHYIEDLVQSVT